MFDGVDTSVQALFVAPSDLLVWAARVRPHIETMAQGSGGRYEASDIISALAAGRMLLWIAVEGTEIRCVMVGEIMNYPRMRALRLTGLVGNNPWKWRGLLPLIEKQAREKFGCTMMESLHQPRYGVFLRGYRATHFLSEKPL
jgi:hypothetical protein